MICIDMDGRLGNEMFQYAGAKAIARRQRLLFSYSRHRHALEEAFLIPEAPFENRVLRLVSLPFRRSSVFKVRTPQKREMVPGYSFEIFDESLFTCGPRTRIQGYLETPEYFAGLESEVREWFRFRPAHRERAEAVSRKLPVPPERRCCVHVRRTDLLKLRYPISHPEHGLALPIDYYAACLARVPRDHGIVVIGDEVDFIRPLLQDREHVHYSTGESAPVDMALMGCCRWNIISNSTFAWWGAWLNASPDRRVTGPKYFRGWHVKKWEQPGLAVPEWEWIDWRE